MRIGRRPREAARDRPASGYSKQFRHWLTGQSMLYPSR
jgi:hypothetical protein